MGGNVLLLKEKREKRQFFWEITMDQVKTVLTGPGSGRGINFNFMKQINFSKKDLASCANEAEKRVQNMDGHPNYFAILKRELWDIYNSLLQKKAGREKIFFRYDGRELNGDTSVVEEVSRDNGFTGTEYTFLTGMHLPYDNGGCLFALDEEGKVRSYEPNGGVSVSMGAPVFSQKGRLVKNVKIIAKDVSFAII